MPSPFPGMDPFVEHPSLWPDVHNALIATIRADLAPLLRPRYVARRRSRRLRPRGAGNSWRVPPGARRADEKPGART